MTRTQILYCYLSVVGSSLVVLVSQGALREENNLGPGDDSEATRIFKDQAMNSNQITMSRWLLSMVSSMALAGAPAGTLNKLNRDQLAGIGVSFKRSRNTVSLNQFMDKLNKDNCIILANQMTESPHNLTRNVRVNLLQSLVKNIGEPETWSSSYIKNIGGELLKGLRPSDVTKMAAKSKFSFETLADELLNKTKISRRLIRAIGDTAKRIMGDPIKWNQDTIGRFARFSSPKTLKTVRPDWILGALDRLSGQHGLQATQARVLVSKLKHPTAFGSISQWNTDKFKRLGQLAHGLSSSDIASISPSSIVRDAVDELGKVNFTIAQAREFIKHIRNVDSPDLWSAEYLRKMGYLTKGIVSVDFQKMRKESVDGALYTLSRVSKELSLAQIRKIATKIDDTSLWTNQKASSIGNLCYGKTAEQLKKIPYYAVDGLVKSMSPQLHNVEAQKRGLESAFFRLSPVNLTRAGPICSVLTLNDLQNTNVEKELGFSNLGKDLWLPWRYDQAILLVEKVKSLKGETDKWSEDFIRSLSQRSLLRGLSRKEIANIALSNFTLEEFSKDKKLLSGQKEAIIKAFSSKRGFTKATLGAIESMGGLLAEARKEDIEKMSRDIASQAVEQIGLLDVNGRPFDWIRQRLRIVMKVLGKDHPSDLSSVDVIHLGNLICGLTSSGIKDMKNEVFDDTMDFIGERRCFRASQLEALAEKAKHVFKKDGSVQNILPRITGDELYEMGYIIEGFSSNDLRNLSQATVRENVNFLGLHKWTAEQASSLIERLTVNQRGSGNIVADVSRRNSAELVAMGNLLKGLTPSDIVTINPVEYDGAASTVGKIDGFTRAQLEAWATVAKQAWKLSTAQFTPDQLQRLGNIAIGFKGDDIGAMQLSSDDVIYSLGSTRIETKEHVGYSRSQLRSGLSQFMSLKKKPVGDLSSTDISNLNNFAVAMTTSEIDTIHTSTFKNCIGQLGRRTEWSHDQMKALKKKAVEAYGPVDKWTTEQVNQAGSIIGGLSGSELESLSEEQVAMVTPYAIKNIPPSLFKKFKSSQLQQLDSTQATAVTNEQLKELSVDSQKIIKRKAGYEEEPQPSSGFYHQCGFIWFTAGLVTAALNTW